MSTIGSLLALASDPGIKPWDDIVKSSTQAQTGLRELADLKRKQASEALIVERIQNDPELRQRLFGDSILGSLGTAPGGQPGAPGGMPGPGPITQSPLGGGPAQQIPASPDLSRFANVPPTGGGPIPPNVMGQTMPTVTPPQSVLGSLGPQGGMPGGPQGPQNPLLAMAAKDPRAALMLQQQMQAQQDRQWTMQTQALNNRGKVLDYLGRMAQGATDQDSWKSFLEEADRVQPGSAARLPQTYSKEARDGVVAQALEVKETMTLQVAEIKAHADMMKARREQANIPNYTGDAQLDAIIYTRMKDQPAGTMPSREIVEEAYKQREADKLRVSREQGRESGVTAAEIERTEKPLEGEAGKAVSDLTTLRKLSDDVAALRHDDYSGPVVGRTGYLREQAGSMGQQETAFRATIKNMTDILARLRSGAAIPPDDMARLESLVPSVNDHPETFKAKLQNFQRAVEQQRETRLQVGTTGRGQLREEMKPTTPRVGEQPTSQGSTGKPVSQMNAEETRAEIAAIKARGGK